jgi:hypothetical protein
MEGRHLEGVSSEEAAMVVMRARSFGELRLGCLTIHKEPGWVAVPYPAGIGDFGDREASSLVELVGGARTEKLWVVTDEPRAFRVTAVAERLLEAAKLLSIYDVGFLPASFAWYVLASEAEFSVVIGKSADVTAFVGATPQEAIVAFRNYLADWQSVPPLIEAIAAAPWERYETLPAGSDFEVTWPTT